MPLPFVTKQTADSLAKAAKDNPEHYLEVLQKLEKTNPILYNYLDYTIALVTKQYNKMIAGEVASVVGMTLGLLESQAEADEMNAEFAKSFTNEEPSDLLPEEDILADGPCSECGGPGGLTGHFFHTHDDKEDSELKEDQE